MNISIGADSVQARDRLVMTPHFTGAGPGDWNSAAASAAAAISSWLGSATKEVRCTFYNAEGPPPHFPLGTGVVNADTFSACAGPREVALCLSYYSGQNVVRRRGRLYVPVGAISGTLYGVRPNSTIQSKVLALAPILQGVGGTSLAWAVYSRADSAAFPVTDVWCDDEWDTVRSRGLKATSRITASSSG